MKHVLFPEFIDGKSTSVMDPADTSRHPPSEGRCLPNELFPHLKLPAKSSAVLRFQLSPKETHEFYRLADSRKEEKAIMNMVTKMRDKYEKRISEQGRRLIKMKQKCNSLKGFLRETELLTYLPTSKLVSCISKAIESSFDQWYLTKSPGYFSFQIHRNCTVDVIHFLLFSGFRLPNFDSDQVKVPFIFEGSKYVPSLSIMPSMPNFDLISSEFRENGGNESTDPDDESRSLCIQANVMYRSLYGSGDYPSIIFLVWEGKLKTEQELVEMTEVWFSLPNIKMVVICQILPGIHPDSLQNICIWAVQEVDKTCPHLLCLLDSNVEFPHSVSLNLDGISYSDFPLRPSSQEWVIDTWFLRKFAVGSLVERLDTVPA